MPFPHISNEHTTMVGFFHNPVLLLLHFHNMMHFLYKLTPSHYFAKVSLNNHEKDDPGFQNDSILLAVMIILLLILFAVLVYYLVHKWLNMMGKR